MGKEQARGHGAKRLDPAKVKQVKARFRAARAAARKVPLNLPALALTAVTRVMQEVEAWLDAVRIGPGKGRKLTKAERREALELLAMTAGLVQTRAIIMAIEQARPTELRKHFVEILEREFRRQVSKK